MPMGPTEVLLLFREQREIETCHRVFHHGQHRPIHDVFSGSEFIKFTEMQDVASKLFLRVKDFTALSTNLLFMRQFSSNLFSAQGHI